MPGGAREDGRVVYPEILRVRADGSTQPGSAAVLAEHTLLLTLNGQPCGRVVCTRGELREMIAGRLYTQKRIDAFAEIEEIRFSPDEDRAEIRLAPEAGAGRPIPHLKYKPRWEHEWILSLARLLREGMPLYRETAAAHCAILARRGALLYACEDISRHNAVDKALGHALSDGVALMECMLMSSGRIPADMVEKAAAAGVPVLVTKATPTADAVRLAAQYGMTLIGLAREDGFAIF